MASYRDENTRSRPITEVKHRRAGIVLGWGTAWELPVGHFSTLESSEFSPQGLKITVLSPNPPAGETRVEKDFASKPLGTRSGVK